MIGGQLLLRTRVEPCIVGLLLAFWFGQKFLADDDELGAGNLNFLKFQRFRLDVTRSGYRDPVLFFLQQFHLALHHHAFTSTSFPDLRSEGLRGKLAASCA